MLRDVKKITDRAFIRGSFARKYWSRPEFGIARQVDVIGSEYRSSS
jgi:hypothetical protein